MLAKSKIISIILAIIFGVSAITCGILWSVLYTPNTNSFNSSSSLSSNAIIVGELYDNNTNKYSGTNISTFIKMLANSDVGNLDTIKNNIGLGIINANTLRGYTNAGNQANKSIVVTLGGFTWVVTYVSLANGLDANNDGQNDVIATLWLTGDQTLPSSKFGDSNYEYGANSSSGFPTAMYGTSYLRAVINNGGNYIK
ncbi:MAG: hypothetical protein J6C13_04500, partial [Clostridia bacterium]|nr:hypothetical protein [Clostridia bacterium]